MLRPPSDGITDQPAPDPTTTRALAARKVAALEGKLTSLTWEFERWQAESAQGKSLEKHHSQIRRVCDHIRECEALVLRDLEKVREQPGTALEAGRQIEELILEVHRLWHFFRSKLALRTVPWMHGFLAAVDDFAWACYKPASALAVKAGRLPPEAVKEPPLAYLSGSWSPIATPRHARIDPEPTPPDERAVPIELLPVEELAKVMDDLPVSVVGLPWYQVAHFPDVTIVGHEVGHLVEDDLGLDLARIVGDAMSRARPSIPQSRRDTWLGWTGEVFADVYGTLATGCAFTATVMDFLAVATSDVAKETRPGGDYPPTTLRVLLNCHALAQCGFEAEGSLLREQWQSTYRKHALTDFEPDIPVVVGALLRGPYPELGGIPLTDVLSFTKAAHQTARADAKRVLSEQRPKSRDVRRLAAAAALAFHKDPDRFLNSPAQSWILERITESREAGVRHGVRTHVTDEELAVVDRAAGAKLYARLKQR
jgi:hypothetical protein